MARFERSKERSGKRNFRGNSSRRDNDDFEYSPKKRRDFNGRGRGKSDFQKTKVICSSCGKECEVPFKPTSNKPIYCDDCFSKKDKKNSNNSSKDLEIINKKLDKIMKALDID